MYTAQYWNDRYASGSQIWSGNANPRLVEHAENLTPGTALDVGSGEGADAIWLASRGWQVTAVDISTVALERAAAHAGATAPAEAAGRIQWQQADLLAWSPPAEQFDLVSAQFMHLPAEALRALHERLAAAVSPGGTLLLVGHHHTDLDGPLKRPHSPSLFFLAEEVATRLDPAQWQIQRTDTIPREVRGPDGNLVTIHDTVLVARKLASGAH
jgi:SAM-dependent methyltransferase